MLALNTWHGHGDTRRLDRYLATAPADVVVLSEFGPDKRPLLADLKAAYPFQVELRRRLALLAGVAVARCRSRRPASAASPSDQPDFVWARLGGSLTIIGTHLHRPSRDPWLHERQVAALAQFMRRIDGAVVLAGDLNTSPWSNAFRKLRAVTGLVSRQHPDAELAGLAAAAAAGGARSHPRLAGARRGSSRHRARRRLRSPADLGAARAAAGAFERAARRSRRLPHALQRRARISAASSLLTSAANMAGARDLRR